jgi:fatty-acid peroxygenase
MSRSELSLALVRDRYQALRRLRAAHDGADWFPVRMLGRRGLVVRGQEGVRAFYDNDLVARSGAMPAPVRLVLFGPGAVHGLDGDAHAFRKRLLRGLLDDEAVERLAATVSAHLDEAVATWPARGSVRLFDALIEVYGAAALEWAGTGISGRGAVRVSRDLATIVDGFGVGGTAYPRAVAARVRAQRWATTVVREARSGRRQPPMGTAAAVLAAVPRSELPDLAAATELLNLVRPTVAVACFGAYAAQALAARPAWREPLAAGEPAALRAFEHEVRRWYPFTPFLTGRLRRSCDAPGGPLRAGDWVVLDVLGTNRDPACGSALTTSTRHGSSAATPRRTTTCRRAAVIPRAGTAARVSPRWRGSSRSPSTGSPGWTSTSRTPRGRSRGTGSLRCHPTT